MMLGNQFFRGGSLVRFFALATAAAVSPAIAQPNLEVRIENVIQSNFATFTFQPTDVGATTPQVVVLRNIGSADLLFPSASPVSLDGAFPEQFQLVQPPLESGNKLSPNGSTAFLIRFAPAIPKAQMSAFVRVASNDADTSLFSINATGIVPVATMIVSSDEQSITEGVQVNLADTAVGEVASRAISIQNAGARPLTLTNPIDVSGGFGSNAFSVVGPASNTIQPGESVTFEARFAPVQAGSASATIGISSSDIGNFPNGRLTFVLRALATPALDDANPDSEPNAGGDTSETPDDGEIDQEDTNTGGDSGTPINVADDDAGSPNDGNDTVNPTVEDEIAQTAIGGLCGGGLGFAPLASLAGLAAFKRRRRA